MSAQQGALIFNLTGVDLVYILAMIGLVATLLLLARVFYALVSRFDVNHELTEADNPAIGVALFGYLAGIVIVIAALLSTEMHGERTAVGLAWDLGEVALYGLMSILLLRLSGWINDRFILHRFENKKELITDRNVGAGAVLCGTYIASGLVLAGAVSGRISPAVLPPDPARWLVVAYELGVGAAFFALGQLVLILYCQLYQRFCGEDPLGAIEADYVDDEGRKHGGNAAAGIAMGGNMAAVGVVLWGAVRGDFVGWAENLLAFAMVTTVGMVLLPIWRLVVARVLLGEASLTDEIYRDRNPNAALLETVAVVGLAIAIALMVRPELAAAGAA